jgi:cysteinyl-tRNA synthetase
MSWKHLGKQFDIHGGGIDLVFPHHENELAQSCCAFHENRMANFWMHNGFLQVEGEKMSKSLGNFVTIRELLADWPGEVLRLNMLKTHYRSPINWTTHELESSQKILDRWYEFIADEPPGPERLNFVVDPLLDDLNAPLAISRLHAAFHPDSDNEHDPKHSEARAAVKTSANLLGLLKHTASEWRAMRTAGKVIDSVRVESMLAARLIARKAKNFKESDRIRDELATMGVALKDSKDPKTGEPITTWEIAP